MTPSEQYNDFAIAANNAHIKICGARYVDVLLDNENYRWKFLIADIKRHISGCDFFLIFQIFL